MVHDLHVLIYCLLNIIIQQYIAQYTEQCVLVAFDRWTKPVSVL